MLQLSVSHPAGANVRLWMLNVNKDVLHHGDMQTRCTFSINVKESYRNVREPKQKPGPCRDRFRGLL